MVFLLGIPSSPATPAVIIAVALPAATPTKPTICCVSSRLWKEIFPQKTSNIRICHWKICRKTKDPTFFDIHRFHDSKSKEIPMQNTLWNINRGSIYIQKLLIFTNTSASHRAGKKNTSTVTNFGANVLTFGFLGKKMPFSKVEISFFQLSIRVVHPRYWMAAIFTQSSSMFLYWNLQTSNQ